MKGAVDPRSSASAAVHTNAAAVAEPAAVHHPISIKWCDVAVNVQPHRRCCAASRQQPCGKRTAINDIQVATGGKFARKCCMIAALLPLLASPLLQS